MMLVNVGAVHWLLLLGVINKGWRIHGTIYKRWQQWCCQSVNGCKWSIWLLILRGWSRYHMDFLLVSFILPTENILFLWSHLSSWGIVKERLIVFYLPGLEAVCILRKMRQCDRWACHSKSRTLIRWWYSPLLSGLVQLRGGLATIMHILWNSHWACCTCIIAVHDLAEFQSEFILIHKNVGKIYPLFGLRNFHLGELGQCGSG